MANLLIIISDALTRKLNKIGIDSGSVTLESISILFVSTGIGIGSAWPFLYWNRNRNQFQKLWVELE